MARAGIHSAFAWMLTGSAVLALAQWLLVVTMARRGSAQVVGDWTLALAATAPVFVFAQFKLRAVQSADVREAYPWSDYVALRAIGMAAALLVSVVLGRLLFDAPTAWVILLVALGKAVEGGCDLLYGRLQRFGMFRAIGVALLRRAALMLLCGVLAFWFARSAAGAAIGVVAGYSMALLFDWTSAGEVAGTGVSPRHMPVDRVLRLARRSFPLGVSTALGSLRASVPRLVLESVSGRAAVGVLGVLTYPLLAVGLVISTMAQMALPELARMAVAQEERAVRGRLVQLCATGAMLGATAVTIIVVAGKPLLTFLYPEAYGLYAREFVWLAMATGVEWTIVFLGTGLDALGDYSTQPWIVTTSLLVVAVLSGMLAPVYGIRGVAWAMLAAASVEGTLLLLAVRRAMRHADRRKTN